MSKSFLFDFFYLNQIARQNFDIRLQLSVKECIIDSVNPSLAPVKRMQTRQNGFWIVQ
jgi:hypothetical protein